MKKAFSILRWIIMVLGTTELVGAVIVKSTGGEAHDAVLLWAPIVVLCLYYERRYYNSKKSAEATHPDSEEKSSKTGAVEPVKARTPLIVKILIFLAVVLCARGIGYLMGKEQANNDNLAVREQYRTQLVQGCLDGSKDAAITQESKIAYCGCISAGFLQMYPDNTILTERMQSSDYTPEESTLISTCLSRHTQAAQ